MKRIEIKKQPRLGIARTIRATVDGIRYRLFRSSVTVAVVAIAVAFLMNMVSESLIKRKIHASTSTRISELRQVHEWAGRLSVAPAREKVLRELASGEASRLDEIRHMGGLSAEQLQALTTYTIAAVPYLDFLSLLEYGPRRNLCRGLDGVAVFESLLDQTEWDHFTNALLMEKTVTLPGRVDDFRSTVLGWPATDADVKRICDGYAQAVAQASEARQGASVMESFVNLSGDFGDTVRGAGFTLEQDDALRLAGQARLVLDRNQIEKTLETPAVRQAMASLKDVMPGDVSLDMLWQLLGKPSGIEQYRAALTGKGGPALDDERIQTARQYRIDELTLGQAERMTMDLGRGFLGMGERMALLLAVSMLVCVIGISNAMLMSVTERFREIATMKCLGALDSTIMAIFVFESCGLGAVGGLIGAIGGAVLGLGRMLAGFGMAFAGVLPWSQLGVAVLVASGAGVILAAVAAVYPAYMAARLAPMEAMRIQ